MTAVLTVLTVPFRLLTPSKGRRVRRSTPLVVSPMASPDYDTNSLERAS